jgi:TRAP-type C4-dicarboxylate transport system permease large subunit
MAEGVPLKVVFKGVTYFLPAYIICILLLLLFPQIVTFLPAVIR